VPQKIVFKKVFTLVLVGVILSTLLAGCSSQKGERAYEPKARQSTTSEDSLAKTPLTSSWAESSTPTNWWP
jgi:hypothetical protein